MVDPPSSKRNAAWTRFSGALFPPPTTLDIVQHDPESSIKEGRHRKLIESNF